MSVALTPDNNSSVIRGRSDDHQDWVVITSRRPNPQCFMSTVSVTVFVLVHHIIVTHLPKPFNEIKLRSSECLQSFPLSTFHGARVSSDFSARSSWFRIAASLFLFWISVLISDVFPVFLWLQPTTPPQWWSLTDAFEWKWANKMTKELRHKKSVMTQQSSQIGKGRRYSDLFLTIFTLLRAGSSFNIKQFANRLPNLLEAVLFRFECNHKELPLFMLRVRILQDIAFLWWTPKVAGRLGASHICTVERVQAHDNTSHVHNNTSPITLVNVHNPHPVFCTENLCFLCQQHPRHTHTQAHIHAHREHTHPPLWDLPVPKAVTCTWGIATGCRKTLHFRRTISQNCDVKNGLSNWLRTFTFHKQTTQHQLVISDFWQIWLNDHVFNRKPIVFMKSTTVLVPQCPTSGVLSCWQLARCSAFTPFLRAPHGRLTSGLLACSAVTCALSWRTWRSLASRCAVRWRTCSRSAVSAASSSWRRPRSSSSSAAIRCCSSSLFSFSSCQSWCTRCCTFCQRKREGEKQALASDSNSDETLFSLSFCAQRRRHKSLSKRCRSPSKQTNVTRENFQEKMSLRLELMGVTQQASNLQNKRTNAFCRWCTKGSFENKSVPYRLFPWRTQQFRQ